jgi:Na+-transporting NADH:ubiquinone oxidoreductase subunit A
MTEIKIKRGLDIPIQGNPQEKNFESSASSKISQLAAPNQVSLNLSSFDDIKFTLLAKVGDVVKIGQPLAEDKSVPGRMFVAPASGTIKDIKRGFKRSLQDIVIELSQQEQFVEFPPIDIERATKEEIIERLKVSGIFSHIRMRPFNRLADPSKMPRTVFVKAIESAPFIPPAELQVQGYEKEFQLGLKVLSKLTTGTVHLVCRKETSLRAFNEAEHVVKHLAEGPHPIANQSLHIERIDPIKSASDNVWTLNAHTVVSIGYLLMRGHCHVERIIGIGGPGLLPNQVGYFKAREGYPIGGLIAGRIGKGPLRLVSGDPLMGKKVNVEDFLGFNHYAFSVIPENNHREFLHFVGLGSDKYTFSKAYLTGHLDNTNREYYFTTNQHGEHRAFIDASLYEKVQPLNISTMLLVKAVLAEDYDLAETLGLLDVDTEDFALPTFVCPSKMEMTEIIKTGLKQYAKEVLQ